MMQDYETKELLKLMKAISESLADIASVNEIIAVELEKMNKSQVKPPNDDLFRRML